MHSPIYQTNIGRYRWQQAFHTKSIYECMLDMTKQMEFECYFLESVTESYM